jgi:pimeloyl-ACP methyl ester carboxylesterase
MYLKNMANKNVIAENNNIKINAATVVNGGKLQTIPLRILTSEKESTNEAWKLSQESFKDWSSDSTQEVIKDVSHYIHQYNPNVVNATILSLLNEN